MVSTPHVHRNLSIEQLGVYLQVSRWCSRIIIESMYVFTHVMVVDRNSRMFDASMYILFLKNLIDSSIQHVLSSSS